MKIKVTKERECCQQEDLKTIEGSPKYGRHSEWVFCVHCGAHHYYESFMDAAGSMDWTYIKALPPWEPKV